MICKERPGCLLETAGGSGMDVGEGSPGRRGSMEGVERELRWDSALEKGCREAGVDRTWSGPLLPAQGPGFPRLALSGTALGGSHVCF